MSPPCVGPCSAAKFGGGTFSGMPAAISSGPGRLPRPAWPAAWWSSGCCGQLFGGPPSGLRRPCAAAALPRAPPRWPVAAAGAFPRPAPLRRGTCAAVPLRWAGRRRAAGVVGPGVRWVWPARCGARAVLPASPRVRLPSALLGRVPLPPPLSGPPPTALGARRHSCGGKRRGRQRAEIRPACDGCAVPAAFPPLGVWASLWVRCCPTANVVEKCRILPRATTSSKMGRKACPRGAYTIADQ